MKKKNKSMLKQGLRYLVIILVAILAMGLYRVMWDMPSKSFYMLLGIVGGVFILFLVLDIASSKDIISIFKG